MHKSSHASTLLGKQQISYIVTEWMLAHMYVISCQARLTAGPCIRAMECNLGTRAYVNTQPTFYCPEDHLRAKNIVEYVESVLLTCITLACTSYKSRLLIESSHRSQIGWNHRQGDGDGMEVLTCWECKSPAVAGQWSTSGRPHSG